MLSLGGSEQRCLDAGERSIRDGVPFLRDLVARAHLSHALITGPWLTKGPLPPSKMG